MRKLEWLFIVLAVRASAETYTLTNGVPVSGTVVSSIVAQVVIKTPLGQLRQIPLSLFSVDALSKMPHEDANYYATTSRLISNYVAMLKGAEKLKASTEYLLEGSADLAFLNDQLKERVRLWEIASSMTDLDASARSDYVEARMKAFLAQHKKPSY